MLRMASGCFAVTRVPPGTNSSRGNRKMPGGGGGWERRAGTQARGAQEGESWVVQHRAKAQSWGQARLGGWPTCTEGHSGTAGQQG